MKNEFLRLAAFRPVPGAQLAGRYHTLAFPAEWRRALADLWNLGRPERPHSGFPISKLNTLLRAFYPGGLSMRGWNDVRDDGPWIYAAESAPDHLFAAILHAWVRALRPGQEYWKATRAALVLLNREMPDWLLDEDVKLIRHQLTPGGTADPDDVDYRLLPDVLANALIRHGEADPYDTGNGLLSFRRVARGVADRGAELLSIPRAELGADGRTSWFSTVIGIQVHTVPFAERIRVHVSTGIRRWVEGPELRLKPGGAASVYLLATAPPQSAHLSTAAAQQFAVARLRRGWRSEGHVWESQHLASAFEELNGRFGRSFPLATELGDSPGGWLDRTAGGVLAGVAHSTRMGSHGIGPGFMPRDREPMTEWIARGLPATLERVADLERVHTRTIPRNPPFKVKGATTEERTASRKAEEQLRAVSRRARLAVLTGGAPLRLELLWTRKLVLSRCVEALGRVLGLDGQGGEGPLRTWATPELNVHLHLIRAAELGSRAGTSSLVTRLGLSHADARSREALASRFNDRRAEVCRAFTSFTALGRPDAPALTLVEIARRESFIPRLSDPKYAVRLGASDAGRVTQFVQSSTGAKEYQKQAMERYAAAWLDGFRQLGLRIVPRHSLDGLPEGLQYIGVWAVRRTAGGPTRMAGLSMVAVRVRPGAETEPGGAISGWDPNSGTWVPYSEYLLLSAQCAMLPDPGPDTDDAASDDGEWFPAAKDTRAKQQDYAENFLHEVLYSSRARPTLLLVHAQNIRSLCPSLANVHLVADTLSVGAGGNQRITVHGPHLRVVRVRSAQHGETPQGWAPPRAPGEDSGLAAGLWQAPDDPAGRVFFSTADKPDTARIAAVRASKFVSRPLTKGKRAGEMTMDTHITAYNPTLLEITVVACQSAEVLRAAGRPTDDPDNPEDWAALTHQLRRAADYRSALLLPLPVHLAKQVAEYILPTAKPSSEADGEDENGSSGDA